MAGQETGENESLRAQGGTHAYRHHQLVLLTGQAPLMVTACSNVSTEVHVCRHSVQTASQHFKLRHLNELIYYLIPKNELQFSS